jgi:hypothetical protein
VVERFEILDASVSVALTAVPWSQLFSAILNGVAPVVAPWAESEAASAEGSVTAIEEFVTLQLGWVIGPSENTKVSTLDEVPLAGHAPPGITHSLRGGDDFAAVVGGVTESDKIGHQLMLIGTRLIYHFRISLTTKYKNFVVVSNKYPPCTF